MKRGHVPTPPHLRKLAGDPGKRRKRPPPVGGRTLAAKLPAPPPFVQGEARAEWLRVGQLLEAAGRVTELDRAALTLYCMTWARSIEVEALVRERGLVGISTKRTEQASPALTILLRTNKMLLAIAAELGLTPVSRGRVALVETPRPEAVDPIEVLVERQGAARVAEPPPAARRSVTRERGSRV